MAGLNGARGCAAFFVGALLVSSVTGLFFAQFMAAIAGSAAVAISLYPLALFSAIAFAGFILYLPSLPPYLGTWAPLLSFLRFSFQAIVRNEFDDAADLPAADLYIQTLGFQDFGKWECLAIVVVFMGFFAIATLLSLKFISYERR